MAHSPSIPTLIREQFRASHVKHLPAVKPHRGLFLAVSLFQARPNCLLAPIHLAQPILTSPRIVHPTHPPLLGQGQVILEEMEEISTRHGAAREEMCAHPPFFEVVWCILVCKDVHKQLPTRFQCMANLVHEQRVVLHVFEQLNADHSVVRARHELVSDHIASDDLQVCESFPRRLAFNVDPLGPRVGKGRDVGFREALRQI